MTKKIILLYLALCSTTIVGSDSQEKLKADSDGEKPEKLSRKQPTEAFSWSGSHIRESAIRPPIMRYYGKEQSVPLKLPDLSTLKGNIAPSESEKPE